MCALVIRVLEKLALSTPNARRNFVPAAITRDIVSRKNFFSSSLRAQVRLQFPNEIDIHFEHWKAFFLKILIDMTLGKRKIFLFFLKLNIEKW